MVRLYTDPRMLDHVTGRGHPERPERLAAVLRQLERTGLMESHPSGLVREATDEEIERVHSVAYLQRLKLFEAEGGGLIEGDTWVRPGSLLAARLGAGACIEAVSTLFDRDEKRALCLIRPPGHHALADDAMGFCIFGNVSVAAADAIQRFDLDRVLIVDWDVHHGNGTQAMFYEDPRVAFLSIHRHPFYPGTGLPDETGTGRGLGTTRNIPLPYGTPRSEFLAAFRSGLGKLADRTRPQLVILSAGFDAHAEDPVGDLGLEIEDFVELTREVVAVAQVHAEGRIVSVLEGGYNTSILAGCVEAHLRALEE
jgi:acetoin utilization deacetylase AcuC-like enzyme